MRSILWRIMMRRYINFLIILFWTAFSAAWSHEINGRLGVYAVDLKGRVIVSYHAGQRFPLCSTAKVMAVAAVLKRRESLSPLSQPVEVLCRLAIERSDNDAMNALLRLLGGPKAVTAFARSIGDLRFRLDRSEPELNAAIPGDPRDTTTPKAMVLALKALLFGDVLNARNKQRLTQWLLDNKTGDQRLRAGVPKDWVVADKTGTGAYGTTNDVGVIWRPNKSPLIIAVYYTQAYRHAKSRDDVIRDVVRQVADSADIAGF